MDSNTSFNIVKDSMEKLQHRSGTPLPDLPAKLIRNTPGSVLSPIVVQPVEIKVTKIEPKKDLIKPVVENLRVKAGLPAEFKANDAVNSDGLQAALREWQQKYGTR